MVESDFVVNEKAPSIVIRLSSRTKGYLVLVGITNISHNFKPQL